MVMWPINLIYFTLKSYISQTQLFSPSVQFCHRYDPSSILASTQIQPSQPIRTSSLRRKSPTCHWAVANQTGMLKHKLIERLLAGSRCVIQVMNYVLDRSDFREQIIQTIDQTRAMWSEWSKQYKQRYGQSNAVRAIKAIWLTIRLERCDQSDITSDTIRTNPGVVTVTLLVALRQRPETRAKAWCSGGWCKKIKSGAIPDSIH